MFVLGSAKILQDSQKHFDNPNKVASSRELFLLVKWNLIFIQPLVSSKTSLDHAFL